jgi:hypothetical protein
MTTYRLVYWSKREPHCTPEDVKRIFTTSLATNSARGLSGALLVSDTGFAQILEGSRTVIEALFERIEIDERHSDVTVLSFEEIDRLLFQDGMACFSASDLERGRMDRARLSGWPPMFPDANPAIRRGRSPADIAADSLLDLAWSLATPRTMGRRVAA